MINIIILISLLLTMNQNTNLYSQAMVVTNVENEVVTCVDFNGEEWTFTDDSEEWENGVLVSCIMSDNGTEEIYDDEILSVKYDGWICGSWGFDGENAVIEFN